MVNYKRVVCEVAVVLALVAAVAAAPTSTPDCHYDQRQNGSENYRLNIDGVVIAVAPADSLLAAASEIDLSDLLDLSEYDGPSSHKPQLEPKPEDGKPQNKPQDKPEDKPDLSVLDVSQNTVKEQKQAFTRKQEKAHRLKNRLAQFLMPLLRKTRHH
ncbi:uncharacterized protein LOC134742537 [Cydia strobilella]|uniref:uncharacterized protein LOC134742537 n=1 Tax=Cydia strobilella TaxID=1100964 RepID=UPI0030055627